MPNKATPPVDLGALGFTASHVSPEGLSVKELRSNACQVASLFVVDKETKQLVMPLTYAEDVKTPKHRKWADYCLSCAELYGEKLRAEA